MSSQLQTISTLARTTLSVQFIESYYRLASISSSVSPLVSGTTKNMKTRDATAITPNPEKSRPVPIKSYKVHTVQLLTTNFISLTSCR
jgi:hypothetical protein